MNFTHNKIFDIDAINSALENKSLVIVPTQNEYSSEFCRVSQIKKHNRKRKDGIQRYIISIIKYIDADPCCCELFCACSGNMHAYDIISDPLTTDEILENYNFCVMIDITK